MFIFIKNIIIIIKNLNISLYYEIYFNKMFIIIKIILLQKYIVLILII